ncbi:MAG: asparaginase [Acidothermales bacterium]|nr:asparaginase [Acidothermales bacterium]
MTQPGPSVDASPSVTGRQDGTPLPVLAEVVRSGFVESVHTGSVVAIDPEGHVLISLGRPDEPCYPRSSNKPLQAVAMVRAGLDIPDDLLALASASHAGEDMHVDGVRRMLATVGLDETALQCPEDLPGDDETRMRMIRSGAAADRIHMNCSGKHAAMLTTCVLNGWPVETYLDPEHPLQVHVREVVEELAGEKVAHIGVDGCGAPLFAFSLKGLARAYQAIITAEPGTAERRVADAFRAYPEMTSGTKRPEARLMRGIAGSLNKGGAEAVDAVALSDGTALAVKIADGGQRARVPVTVATLAALGQVAPVPGKLNGEDSGGYQLISRITCSKR